MSPRRRSHLLVFTLVLAAAGLYVWSRLDVNWIPHDEGCLAHSAERVLGGEWPHRDFDELYTGLLSLLHALVFHVFGTDLIFLRRTLFVFTMFFVAVLYAIATRLGAASRSADRGSSAWVSGAVTLLALAWGMPNYFASMPSWYNLIFAAGGTLALLRHLETGQRRYLFLAGLCGGISFLFKSVGLFFIAAAGLFLIHREQSLAAAAPAPARDSTTWKALVGSALFVFCSLLVLLVAQLPGVFQVLAFLVPGMSLAFFLSWHEMRFAHGTFSERRRRLTGLVVPFVLGVALPLGLFLIPYIAGGALEALYTGVFVLPRKRFEHAAAQPPPLGDLLRAVPAAVLLFVPLLRDTAFEKWPGVRFFYKNRRFVEVLVLAYLAWMIWIVYSRGGWPANYSKLWNSVRPLVPLVTLAGCLALVRHPYTGDDAAGRRQKCFLLLAASAMTSMVQYPFIDRVYFFYVAPFLPLVILAMLSLLNAAPRRIYAAAAALYFVFAVTQLHRVRRPVAPLEIAGASLRVPEEHAESYGAAVALVREHSTPGAAIYASPDCPEIYYLSRRRNPTRTLFDFFEHDHGAPERQGRLLKLLDDEAVNVVVACRRPHFSGRLSQDFLGAIAERYPESVSDPYFTVYWRRPPKP